MSEHNCRHDDGLDLLHGAKAIGDYLGITERRAFHLLEKALIPATKLGNLWTASKRKLRERVEGSDRCPPQT